MCMLEPTLVHFWGLTCRFAETLNDDMEECGCKKRSRTMRDFSDFNYNVLKRGYYSEMIVLSNQKQLHSAASKQFEATKWSWNWINEASLWQCNCSMSFKAYAREVTAAWLWFALVTSICFTICLYACGWFGNKLWNVLCCSNWGSLIELC